MHRILTILAAAIALGMAGCERSAPAPAASARTTGAADRITRDLKSAGEDLKDVGSTLKDKAEPAIHEAKEEAKGAIHHGAEKVAEWTASGTTAPATAASQP